MKVRNQRSISGALIIMFIMSMVLMGCNDSDYYKKLINNEIIKREMLINEIDSLKIEFDNLTIHNPLLYNPIRERNAQLIRQFYEMSNFLNPDTSSKYRKDYIEILKRYQGNLIEFLDNNYRGVTNRLIVYDKDIFNRLALQNKNIERLSIFQTKNLILSDLSLILKDSYISAMDDGININSMNSIIKENSSKIKYGQDYDARIFFKAYDTTNHPVVIIGDYDSTYYNDKFEYMISRPIDTLRIEDGTGVFNVKNPQKGHHLYTGLIKYRSRKGYWIKRSFNVEFVVE